MSDVNPKPADPPGIQRGALRLCLWAGVVGPVTFFVVFTIDGALKTGCSALRDAVSYLALGAYGWIQTLNFIFLRHCVDYDCGGPGKPQLAGVSSTHYTDFEPFWCLPTRRLV